MPATLVRTAGLFKNTQQDRHTGKLIEDMVAKAAYVKKSKTWKVYWMRGNFKWTRYEPCPEVKAVEEFLGVVKEDGWGCFFG